MTRIKRQAGFTLVELLISMAIFSFVLMIIVSGIIHLLKQYQAGVSARNVQQNSRYALDDITRTARISRAANASADTLCLTTEGGKTIYYVTGSPRQLARAQIHPNLACSSASVSGGVSYLTSTDTKVTIFEPTLIAGNPGTVQLRLKMASSTGDTDASGDCVPGVAGYQYCAVADLTTTTSLRGAINE